MALKTYKAANRREVVDQLVRALHLLALPQALTNPTIGNGSTAGNLRTTTAADYRSLAGAFDTVASTDDHWDLSGETDTAAGVYQAYWLYHDGTFSTAVTGASLTAAIQGLPAPDTSLAVFGVYVAGPETDFDDAGGLAAQGTIISGVPLGWLDLASNAVPEVLLDIFGP